MAKFALLFIGGLVPDDKRDQNSKDWTAWMGKIGASGALKDGAPFGPVGKVVAKSATPKDYDWHNDSNVGGYCIVEADNVDAAVALTDGCPQMDEAYGSGTIEVRELLAM